MKKLRRKQREYIDSLWCPECASYQGASSVCGAAVVLCAERKYKVDGKCSKKNPAPECFDLFFHPSNYGRS